ncbi:MAG: HupE/UreJ family protein, partial [Xanthomonadales bacterium]|nr:HupE/UreJ family protein [Xanthomonadales bacterium]NIX13238.1 HupE/UreJ family protein [Xanthomonadales bacterium]
MNRGSFILFLLGLLLLLPNSASHAHEVRPGYLSLKQVAEDRFQVMWRVPARGERRLSLAARLPATCLETEPRSHYLGGGASTQRWSVHCPGGLAGGTLGVDGLQGTLTDVLVRVEQSNGLTQVKRLSPSESTFVVPQASSMADVAAAYGVLGVEHILLGVDHLLFVAALMLLVQRGRL